MREEDNDFICVRTVLGKKYKVPEERAQTVADLKQELHALSGIHPEQQILIVNGALCKDQKHPLSHYGSDLICILAEKVEQQTLEQSRSVQESGQAQSIATDWHYCANCANSANCKMSHPEYKPFLTKNEQQAYKNQVQNSYSRKTVRDLMNIMGESIDEGMAIRAVRACQNELSDAIDFIDLEKKGENFKQMTIDNMPVKEPRNQQTFLMNFVEQHQLKKKLAKSKEAYILFVASMKQKSPLIYEMLIRNRRFMEKYLFEPKTSNSFFQNTLQHSLSSNKPIINNFRSLRVNFRQDQRKAMLQRLMEFGILKQDAEIQLREVGNNILLAEERLFQGHPNIDPNRLIQMIPIECHERMVTMFFQSPAWDPFKAKLKSLDHEQAYQLVVGRLSKHFPFIFQMVSINLWCIYPLLLGVPFCSIQRVNLVGSRPSVNLRRRTKEEVDRAHRYYFSLIDRDIVNRLEQFGVEPSFAERAVRAGGNMAFEAVKFVIAGKIPMTPEAWSATEENERIAIDQIMKSHLGQFLIDTEEFELKVASLADCHPAIYQGFIKFQGIIQAYRHRGSTKIQTNAPQIRMNMKRVFLKMPNIRQFYEYGQKMPIFMKKLYL